MSDSEAFEQIQSEALRQTERELWQAEEAFERCLRDQGFDPSSVPDGSSGSERDRDEVLPDDPILAAELSGYGFAPVARSLTTLSRGEEQHGDDLSSEERERLAAQTAPEAVDDPQLESTVAACHRSSGLGTQPEALGEFARTSTRAWEQVHKGRAYADLLNDWRACMARSGYRAPRPEAIARAAEMALATLSEQLEPPIDIAGVDSTGEPEPEPEPEEEIRALVSELFGDARSLDDLVERETTLAVADARCQDELDFRAVLRREYETAVVRLQATQP